MTDLFSFASFLPFPPPQVLREGTVVLSLDRLLVRWIAHVCLDIELAMVYHLYFGDSTMYFSISVYVVLDIFILADDFMMY